MDVKPLYMAENKWVTPVITTLLIGVIVIAPFIGAHLVGTNTSLPKALLKMILSNDGICYFHGGYILPPSNIIKNLLFLSMYVLGGHVFLLWRYLFPQKEHELLINTWIK